jgi:hypothetical protein
MMKMRKNIQGEVSVSGDGRKKAFAPFAVVAFEVKISIVAFRYVKPCEITITRDTRIPKKHTASLFRTFCFLVGPPFLGNNNETDNNPKW